MDSHFCHLTWINTKETKKTDQSTLYLGPLYH